MTFLYKTARKCAAIILFVLGLSYVAKATDLNAGDLLFTGYLANAATTDAFSFVLLVDLSGTTTVSFTDNGWTSSNAFRVGEQTIVWTYTGTLAAGSEITISGPSAGAGTARLYNSSGATVIGTCTGSVPSFATSGDQIIAYRGTAGSPTLIAGLHMNVYSTDLGQCANTTNAGWDPSCITENANFSRMPQGLAAGVSAIWIGTEGLGGSEQDNARFTYSSPLTTVAAIRAAVTNPANWESSNVAPPVFTLPSAFPFFSTSLPVKLLRFDGKTSANGVLLTWETNSEINHSHFEVERSNERTQFVKLSRVNGKGDGSSLITSYQFLDQSPLEGINLYRLKITAMDGEIEYSPIVKITSDNTSTSTLDLSPNPAGSHVFVRTPAGRYSEIIILNSQGAVVLRQKLVGTNQRIELGVLPKGYYTLTATGTSEKISKPLVISQ